MSFADQVSKQTNEKLKEMRAAAAKQSLIDLIQQRIEENPFYSFGSLWDEIKRSKGVKEQVMEIPLTEFAQLLIPQKNEILHRRDDYLIEPQKEAIDIQQEMDKVINFLSRDPASSFGTATIAKRTSIPYQRVLYRTNKLLSLGTIVKDDSGFRLNTLPAREFILKCLKSGPCTKAKIDSVNETKIKFIFETVEMLVKIGTIKRTDNLLST